MRNKYFISLVILFLCGCSKTIRHGDSIWWQPKDKNGYQQNFTSQDNKSVFKESSDQKKSYQFNTDVFANQKKSNENNNDFDLNQALNQNAKKSELAKKDNPKEDTRSVIPVVKEVKEEKKCNCPVIRDDDLRNKNNCSLNIVDEGNKTSGKKSYKIQCGYFESKERADLVANKIRQSGIKDVKVIKNDGIQNDERYRVLVGDFKSKNEGMEIWSKINNLDFIEGEFWIYI